ncbi:GDYXXLXY domain-containing protein [Hymenobacter profundi]|uniref:GDYXXLXY domain-containing protein n=1 Tax=Hymenobacter profundi TaxID=1982110 RepID=A0ABS6X5D7_9BACT|nr:GDYXXLXY domain-containing protein [Hymenobacter profundi]MBW3131048.1 GDYXXLXY domain-containing protein [Hymenobacter profundi]
MLVLPTPANRRLWLLLLVGAQLLFIVAVAAAGYATTAYGRTVQLRTAPVNPHDLLERDHLRLTYGITYLPLTLWQEANEPRRRQPVYVALRAQGDAYVAVRVYNQEPSALPPDQVILRGWVVGSSRRTLRLRYGLERYYAPENQVKVLNKKGPHALLVHVSIAPWGQARITKAEVL